MPLNIVSRAIVVNRAGIHAAHLHRVISHQVSAQHLRSQQLQQAALLARLLPRCVVELAPAFLCALGLITEQSKVMISPERQRHILERRQVTSAIDADLAAHRIAEAFGSLKYRRATPRKKNLVELIGYVASADRYLLVAVKLVHAVVADCQQDQLWIQTAHPVGRKTLKRFLAQSAFIPLSAV
jgi:hypothetical protein